MYTLQKTFLQLFCVRSQGNSILIVLQEGMFYPSIFHKMVNNNGSIAGTIPIFLKWRKKME